MLWELAGGVPAWVMVTRAEFSEELGCDGNNLSRWLRALARADLVAIGPRARSGASTQQHVYVYRPCPGQTIDPAERPDPQLSLPFGDPSGGDQTRGESPIGDPNGDSSDQTRGESPDGAPRRNREIGPRASPQLSLRQEFEAAVGVQQRPPPRGALSQRQILDLYPDRNLRPRSVGDPKADALTIEGLAQTLHQRAGDPELQLFPKLKVARAVIDGEIRWEDALRPIEWARRKHLELKGTEREVPFWRLLVGAWKRMFFEHGIPWKRDPRK
jgi:hypothetical protein